jgi:hypothetical protein
MPTLQVAVSIFLFANKKGNLFVIEFGPDICPITLV